MPGMWNYIVDDFSNITGQQGHRYLWYSLNIEYSPPEEKGFCQDLAMNQEKISLACVEYRYLPSLL
jgi:hypothetical protein